MPVQMCFIVFWGYISLCLHVLLTFKEYDISIIGKRELLCFIRSISHRRGKRWKDYFFRSLIKQTENGTYVGLHYNQCWILIHTSFYKSKWWNNKSAGFVSASSLPQNVYRNLLILLLSNSFYWSPTHFFFVSFYISSSFPLFSLCLPRCPVVFQ